LFLAGAIDRFDQPIELGLVVVFSRGNAVLALYEVDFQEFANVLRETIAYKWPKNSTAVQSRCPEQTL